MAGLWKHQSLALSSGHKNRAVFDILAIAQYGVWLASINQKPSDMLFDYLSLIALP